MDYVAGQVKVEPGLLTDYQWTGSTIEYHRSQIRKALGFHKSTRADEEALIEWLARDICPIVLTDEEMRAAMLSRCRNVSFSAVNDRACSSSPSVASTVWSASGSVTHCPACDTACGDVTSCVDVGVLSEAARRTEKGFLVGPVLLVHVPAGRAALRGVGRVHVDHGDT
ncbi:DUF4158 domain-containing protein, partial [Streptosporangium minutum]|uniref:DUF4158 domain-containing protein n=1 Tax=Streptosporangium minutum TaxID=569862 RepID=UPI003BF972B8